MNTLKQKVLLITGANKGIGYGIVRGLLQNDSHFKIILTSRDEERGKKALLDLSHEFPSKQENLVYHQLDISDSKSLNTCVDWVKNTFNQIDILVNNAGVSVSTDEFTTSVFDTTFNTNVYGTINLTEKLLENGMISENGKIVIVGSTAGQIKWLEGEDLKKEFRDENMNLEKLYDLASRFRKSIEDGTWKQQGWCESCYSVSKMVINTYAKILPQRISETTKIQVNSLCPGWVKTDLGGESGELTLEEGIVTPLYVIGLDNNQEFQGKFFYENKVYNFAA